MGDAYIPHSRTERCEDGLVSYGYKVPESLGQNGVHLIVKRSKGVSIIYR